jgi:hypothetical protein
VSRQETSVRALVEAIADHHLAADVKDRWVQLLRPALLLCHAGRADPVAGRLGGMPELPDGVPWPVWEGHGPLSFIAGLDCTALKSDVLDIPLPSEGLDPGRLTSRHDVSAAMECTREAIAAGTMSEPDGLRGSSELVHSRLTLDYSRSFGPNAET